MKPMLTLYDLASASGQPFSPKTWQIRLALNYKQLSFKTVWLPMVDIKQTLQPIGASPTVFPAMPEGVYTVPVLVDTSNPDAPIVISHSLPIAEYLDEKYPEPPLFPSGSKALLALYDNNSMEKIQSILFPLMVSCTLSFLEACDRVYFRETREQWLGCKLEDILPAGPKRERQWEKLKEELDELARLLERNGEGKFFILGDQVSRGDFVLVGLFAWMAKIDSDGWKKVKTWNDGRWGKLWEMTKVWRLCQA